MRSHDLQEQASPVLVALALALGAGWLASTSPLMGLAVAVPGALLLLRALSTPTARAGATVLMGAVVVALAPIDVIDLSGGAAGFGLTPWLLVSVPYAFALLVRRDRVEAGKPSAPGGSDGRGLAAALIAVATISVFFLWTDPWGVSLKRLILTTWLVTFPYIFFSRNRLNAREMIVRGVKAFLVIDATVVVVESLLFTGLLHLPAFVGHYVNLAPVYVGEQIRFNGLIADPNRAAVDLVLMLGLAHFAAAGTEQGLKGLGRWPYVLTLGLVAVTYSRTGLGAVLLLGLVLALKSDQRFRLYLAAILVLVSIGLSYVILSRADYTVKIEDAFSSTQREVATATHIGLMNIGYHVVTQGLKSFIVGVGWGSEYFYTYQFFPADKNGNFHSGFVSVAVNAGVIAFVLYVALVLRPIVRKLPWASLVLVLVWVNIFYQSLAEPIYWMILVAVNSAAIQTPRPDASPAHTRARRDLAIQEAL